jgi:hypothetical protein
MVYPSETKRGMDTMRSELPYIAARAQIEDLHRRAAAERLAARSGRALPLVLFGRLRERLASHPLSSLGRASGSRVLTGLRH